VTDFSSAFECRLASQRIWVDCSGANPTDELDRVCRIFLRQGLCVAVLDDCPGALISNISILENLWLPHAWHHGLSRSQFQAQLAGLVDVMSPFLSKSVSDMCELLRRRPGEVSPQQRSLVVLMRAVLMSPELVLLSSAWISGLVDSSGQMLLKMMHNWLSTASWLAFDEIEPSVDILSTGWSRTQLLYF